MKTKPGYIIMALVAGALFLYQCEKEKSADKTLSGKLISYTECKDFTKSTPGSETIADTLSCVQYRYDMETRKLTLKHINTGFNCCPEELYCSFSANVDTLFINESEKSAMCDCNCLFDMDIEITDVDAGKYQVKFIEPYAEDLDPLLFEIDLVNHPEGSFCVNRKWYPWGQYSL